MTATKRTPAEKELAKQLRSLREEWRDWKLVRYSPAVCHIDYMLAPGTEEGDLAEDYRRCKRAEIEAKAAALKATTGNTPAAGERP